jgi:hypothetical protein
MNQNYYQHKHRSGIHSHLSSFLTLSSIEKMKSVTTVLNLKKMLKKLLRLLVINY